MTREDTIKLAREAGFEEWVVADHLDELEKFAYFVAAAEREACAQLCAEQEDDDYYTGNQYAQAIRARSQP